MPQACRAPQAPQVSKEREVPLVSPEPLDVLGRQVSNGHGARLMFPCAHPHQPPGQSWHSRARARLGLWELSVSRERVVRVAGTVCIQGRLVVGLWDISVQRGCKEEVEGTEGHLHVGGFTSPCMEVGGSRKC